MPEKHVRSLSECRLSATLHVLFSATGHPTNPLTEVEMAKEQTRSSAGRPTHPFLEKLGAQAGWEIFTYSVKIVCGKRVKLLL